MFSYHPAIPHHIHVYEVPTLALNKSQANPKYSTAWIEYTLQTFVISSKKKAMPLLYCDVYTNC
jgi:hypothetical protein